MKRVFSPVIGALTIVGATYFLSSQSASQTQTPPTPKARKELGATLQNMVVTPRYSALDLSRSPDEILKVLKLRTETDAGATRFEIALPRLDPNRRYVDNSNLTVTHLWRKKGKKWVPVTDQKLFDTLNNAGSFVEIATAKTAKGWALRGEANSLFDEPTKMAILGELELVEHGTWKRLAEDFSFVVVANNPIFYKIPPKAIERITPRVARLEWRPANRQSVFQNAEKPAAWRAVKSGETLVFGQGANPEINPHIELRAVPENTSGKWPEPFARPRWTMKRGSFLATAEANQIALPSALGYSRDEQFFEKYNTHFYRPRASGDARDVLTISVESKNSLKTRARILPEPTPTPLPSPTPFPPVAPAPRAAPSDISAPNYNTIADFQLEITKKSDDSAQLLLKRGAKSTEKIALKLSAKTTNAAFSCGSFPIRWRSSNGGTFQPTNPASTNHLSERSRAFTETNGDATSDFSSSQAGKTEIYAEILRLDGSVFKRSNRLTLEVRKAQPRPRIVYGKWEESASTPDLYSRKIWALWVWDGESNESGIAGVPLSLHVEGFDGAKPPKRESWLDKTQIVTRAQTRISPASTPDATQFFRYDPTQTLHGDLDSYLVRGAKK